MACGGDAGDACLLWPRHSGANDARQRCRSTCPSARRSAVGSRDSSRPESDLRRLPSADGPASISPSGSTESSRTKFSMPKHITVAVPCMGTEAEVRVQSWGAQGHRDVRGRRPEMRADTPPDRRDRSTPDCDIGQCITRGAMVHGTVHQHRPTHLVVRGEHVAARRAPLRAGGLDTAGSGLHQTFEELAVLLGADAEDVTRLHARRRGVVAGAIFGAMPHVHDP